MDTVVPALRGVKVLVSRGGRSQKLEPSLPDASKPQNPDVLTLSVKSASAGQVREGTVDSGHRPARTHPQGVEPQSTISARRFSRATEMTIQTSKFVTP